MWQALHTGPTYLDKAENPLIIVTTRSVLQKSRVWWIHPRIIAIGLTFSANGPASTGVPQGGVLSPTLFNIYTYDLLSLLSSIHVKFCAFADDLKLTLSPIKCQILLWVRGISFVLQWDLPLSDVKSR
ncbi:hypothetical protein COOONC_18173, partial [Cooperia oncophora]